MEGKLYRSRNDRKLFGVCGGLGTYVHVDPTLVRVLFVLLALIGAGAGVILYVALIFVVPLEPETGPAEAQSAVEVPPSDGPRQSV